MPTTTTIPVTAGSGINLDAVQVTVSATAVARENICVSDPTSATAIAAVKDASTQAVAADGSLVVQINPNQPNLTTALNVHDASPSSHAVTNAGTFAVQAGPSTAATSALTAKYVNSTASAVIKASAGNLYGVAFLNLNTTSAAATGIEYIQFFNTTTTASLSTTNWAFSLPCPSPTAASGGALPLSIPPGAVALANFSNGITIVLNATSTSNTTASGTGAVGVIWYD